MPYVIVVDDGSGDETAKRAQETGAFVLRHIANRGQGAAIQTGITFALLQHADIIATFDADGQHDVNDLEKVIGPILRRECDVTLGSRFLGTAQGMPLSRWAMLKLAVLLTRATLRVKLTDVHNGFRAFSARAARMLHLRVDRMGHASEILEQIRRSGLRFREVPVTIHYTEYSLGKGQKNVNALRILLRLLFRRDLK